MNIIKCMKYNYTKTLTKIQVSSIFDMRDVWTNVLPKFMETACGGTNMAARNRQKYLLLSLATKV